MTADEEAREIAVMMFGVLRSVPRYVAVRAAVKLAALAEVEFTPELDRVRALQIHAETVAARRSNFRVV